MPLLNNEIFALLVYVVAVLVGVFIVRYRSIQQRALWGIVFLAVIGGFTRALGPDYPTEAYYICAALAVTVSFWALLDRRGEAKRWLARASQSPIVLRPPFRDRWHVAAGGPDPHHNHHTVVSDQVFAYDFLRDDGESWDQPILAPCSGMIAHVENRQEDALPDERRRDRKRPFGNYVSIQTQGGYVILAHLRQGSVTVRVGDDVKTGDEIGRCGNSGNTDGAHLHVHAQNQPSQSVGIAEGVPIAFAERDGREPMLLEYGDTLSS